MRELSSYIWCFSIANETFLISDFHHSDLGVGLDEVDRDASYEQSFTSFVGAWLVVSPRRCIMWILEPVTANRWRPRGRFWHAEPRLMENWGFRKNLARDVVGDLA
jgi:hypothetical protein